MNGAYPVRLEDIAKLAQVSKAAVSLALNGKPGISPETRERIIQIAQESGYMMKTKAAPIGKTGKSLLFLAFTNSGIVLEHYYQQPFFRELIHYTEERCRSKGFSLQFSAVDMEFFERDIELIAAENQSSGVILLGTNLSRPQISSIAEKFPKLVVLDTCYETLPIHFVEINNMMGAYQAGSYLCSIGHRDIGYVASTVRIHNFDQRKRGFKAALKEYSLEIPEARTFSVAPTILSSQDSLKQQLHMHMETYGSLPTALFCECDYIAISVMKTLNELGVRIPEDISIVGFDNISEAIIVSPELTTIHVEKEKMAQVAVDLLTYSIDQNSNLSVKTIVDTKFIERLSCRLAGEKIGSV
jgi:DNA-binding LacI/PurR family transcriptional regulator